MTGSRAGRNIRAVGNGYSIGGYLELELGPERPMPAWLARGVGYQSARSALAALIQHDGVRRVWAPSYTCPVVHVALRWSGVDVRIYQLQPDFLPPRSIELGDGDRLLITAYFGVCSRVIAEAARIWPASRLIIDAAQSLFLPPLEGAAMIYAPRKHVGVADGGFLYRASGLPQPPVEVDTGSVERLTPAIGRLDAGPEAYYQEFQRVEASLSAIAPMRISVLTSRLLGSIDWERISQGRRENFRHLERYLEPFRPLQDLGDDVPLCFPFMFPAAEAMRKVFLENRVYTQRYWNGIDPSKLGDFERKLFNETLFIPCDHRYSADDMQFIAKLFKEHCGAALV